MAKRTDIQKGGIVFGDWKLMPIDSENWELCHRHVPRGADGAPKWNHCGKYYNEHTIGSALRYAADQEMKAKCKTGALEIVEALEIWYATLGEFVECLSGVSLER